MSFPHIEIKSHGPWKVSIEIDGMVIPGVRSYSFSQESDDIPVLNLEIMAGELTFDNKPNIPLRFTNERTGMVSV